MFSPDLPLSFLPGHRSNCPRGKLRLGRKELFELSCRAFQRSCPFPKWSILFFSKLMRMSTSTKKKVTFFGVLGQMDGRNKEFGKLGEYYPVEKAVSIAMGRYCTCVGNPWKRARTAPFKRTSNFKRTSDFELFAREIAMSRYCRTGNIERKCKINIVVFIAPGLTLAKHRILYQVPGMFSGLTLLATEGPTFIRV